MISVSHDVVFFFHKSPRHNAINCNLLMIESFCGIHNFHVISIILETDYRLEKIIIKYHCTQTAHLYKQSSKSLI